MIQVVSGTNRPNNNTVKVARALVRHYEELGVAVELMDLQQLPAEIFHPESYGQKPAGFAPFQEKVLAAGGLHVVAPEYNGSFPGALKYFIDLLKFPDSFQHRCVAFTGLGAGQWGNLRGIEQLQQVFGYRNAHILPERAFIPTIGKQLNVEGTELASPEILERLKAQAVAFAAFVERNAGK